MSTTFAMSAREAEALATIGLLAAQADGRRDASEQAKLSAVFSSFGVTGIDSVHARVTLGNAVLEEEAKALTTPEARNAAWELAIGVCRADGMVAEKERAFLEQLRVALGVPTGLDAALADAAFLPKPAAADATAVATPAPAAAPAVDEAALDKQIQEAAVLAGAIELLPQALATLGVLPIQLKLVADIGAAYGHVGDGGRVKELLATAGLGLSGQAVEGFARRFVARLTGRYAGGTIGNLAGAATSAAATFAATWAIGHVAKAWYANGRRLDAADVQARFARAANEGRAAFDRLQGEIAAKAKSIPLPDVARLIGR